MNLHFVSLLSFLIWSHPQEKVQNHHFPPFHQKLQSWAWLLWLKSIWMKLKKPRPKQSRMKAQNPWDHYQQKLPPSLSLWSKFTSNYELCHAWKRCFFFFFFFFPIFFFFILFIFFFFFSNLSVIWSKLRVFHPILVANVAKHHIFFSLFTFVV